MKGADAKALFEALASTFETERDRLGALDAAVGDGDHGAAMARGFARAEEAARGAGDDVGAVFQAAGRALMGGVGGASGPLFGTLLLELGKAASDPTELRSRDLAAGARAAADRIARLGGATTGDKTLLDALEPAAVALEANADAPLDTALARAAEAARAGAEATAAMAARHGRARYVADAGRGHPDPGAVSTALIFEVLHRATGGTP